MIIGIDASRALKVKRTGTEVHNAEIIKSIVKNNTTDTIRLYAKALPFGDMVNLGKNVEWKIMRFPRGWTMFRLSIEMLFHKPNVLFVPAHMLPLICPKRSVVMIHDVGYDHFPELYSWRDIVYHHYAIRFARIFSGRILVPSKYTLEDLHSRYNIPYNKMTLVYHGFNADDFRPAKSGEQPPIPEPYFYFVGRMEYKKNIIRMLQAFKSFKEQTNLPYKFILAGRPANGWSEIQKVYNELGPVKDDVKFLDYIPQDEAANWLRHSRALVFATLFEGFGVPALEAFASSVPVITSNTTSMPEVVGDAAISVDPTSVDAIADAMKSIAQNEKLRQELIAKGFERMKQFSWDRAAEETLAVLREVGNA